MPRPGQYNQQQAEAPGQGPWVIKLLLRERAELDLERIAHQLRATAGEIDLIGDGKGGTGGFGYRNHTSDFADRKAVPCAHMFASSDGLGDRSDLDLALGQTWDWDGARDAVSRAKVTLFFNDMMASGLDRKPRLELFVRAARAIARQVKPLAIHWLPSQRVVEPKRFVEEDAVEPTSAAVNVRLFRVEGATPGEIVMDTLGMAAFGLPDLQCHFAGLEPGRVAARLFGYAEYLFEQGDVIEDGNTVDGAVPGSIWRCRHEMALVGPDRVVVDMHPGPARPPA